MKRWTTLAVIGASIVLLPLTAAAEDAANDQLKKEMTELKATLELQKGVIDAQKGLLESQIALTKLTFVPELPKGKEGAITVEEGKGDTLHATKQAYDALGLAARALCKMVKAVGLNKDNTVAIITPDDLRLVAQYWIVKGEADALLTEYTSALRPPGTVGVAAVPAAAIIGMGLQTLVDLTKLFRTDRKLAFEAVTLQEAELADMVAMCLTKSDPEDTGPALKSVKYARLETEKAIAFSTSKLLASLDQLAKNNVALDAKIRNAERDLADEAKKGNAGKAKPTDKGQTAIATATDVAAWKALKARYEAFRTSLAGSDAATRLAIMLTALQGEAVANMVKTVETQRPHETEKSVETPKPLKLATRLLTMRVAAAGGTTMVTSSLLSSDKMYSSGGVVVTYRLTDDDMVQLAGSIGTDSPLVEIQKLSAAKPPKTGRP